MLANLGVAHPDGYRQLDLSDAIAHRGALTIVDVREERVSERIPRSKAVPLGRIPEEVGAWRRDTPILVVCEDGRQAAAGAAMLRGMGFSHIWSLNGGIAGWRARRMPLESCDDAFELGEE